MSKHTYRAKKVNEISWAAISDELHGDALILAIDVAKDQQYALLTTQDERISQFIKWPLFDTPELINRLTQLDSPVNVIMEATGTYGDAMRYQFRRAGFSLYHIHAKQVHDAQALYDGVSSLHDAKSAYLIAKLHRQGCTKPWRDLSEDALTLSSLRREYEIHQEQYERNRNRLEAYLSRHWPEILAIFDLGSVTLENLLLNYGAPDVIAAHSEDAAQQMKNWGRHFLSGDKITLAIDSAKTTMGIPCIAAERQYLQALAQEMRHSRCEGLRAKRQLEAKISALTDLHEMALTVGKVTTAALISLHLDPRQFPNAHSYVKALGLNLKEKSSGQIQGRLKLSKRGPSTGRKYLFLAALRLIQRDAVMSKWYRAKADPKAKMKTVAACMRKLAKALWHVARGARFDAAKLVAL
jgi:transposase